jgi:hypothetical protein
VSGRRGALLQLALAVLAAAAAVWSYFGAQTVVTVAPILPGQPETTSVVYSPPLLVLMLLLATVAGVLAALGVAGLRRERHPSRGASPAGAASAAAAK